jgi:hypothetical protein
LAVVACLWHWCPVSDIGRTEQPPIVMCSDEVGLVGAEDAW